MYPQVTVITPTYNHALYIAECIESMLNQTIKEWEMIIIDDGSTDRTADIIKKYKDTRIRYIHHVHRGINFLGEVYNEALNLSKGEFVTILEGDDFFPESRLERQIPVFEDEEIVLSHGLIANVEGGNIVCYPSLCPKDVRNNDPIGCILKEFLAGYNPIATQSVMIRKSFLLEAGGFTQPSNLPLVDYPTWMRLSFLGRFRFIPEVLGFWRRHPTSVTMQRSDEIFDSFIRYCDEFVQSFKSEIEASKFSLSRFVKNRGAIGYLALGLSKLSGKDWDGALKYFKKSWKRKKAVNKPFQMRILISILSTYIHLDLPGYLIKMRVLCMKKGLNKMPFVIHSSRNGHH
ncbi:MAG: glycosyltransferase [Proteobacteria bacterium]|nr:glycosyltransferase [Desulfobacteraceae bacterium]MBU4013907.1 glycosyltransferase [Pseudomonadota bacterium]MBU4127255.1 glycosyltransferase [Pseudomonadota bacterium]